jgi:hypothetical protein
MPPCAASQSRVVGDHWPGVPGRGTAAWQADVRDRPAARPLLLGEWASLGILAEALTGWLSEPVAHLRDVRTELLLKLQLCSNLGIDWRPLVDAQRRAFAPAAASLRGADTSETDPVAIWRDEYSTATIHFLDRLAVAGSVGARQ